MRHLALIAALLATPALAQDVTPVSSTDFAANVGAFNGQTVAISNCEVMPWAGSDGNFSCILKTADGQDAKDPGGLPVYIFFADTPDLQTYIAANCTSYCSSQVTITGTAETDAATGYVKLTNISLAPM